MKKTLFLKFAMGFFIFALFSLIIISSVLPKMIESYFEREEAFELYEHAIDISNNYANKLYTGDISLDTVYSELKAVYNFIDADICILNPSGRMVLDTSKSLNVDEVIMVDGFDPSLFAGNFYEVGKFFGQFTTDHLSIVAPIAADYQIHGYLVIHKDFDDLEKMSIDIQNLVFIVFAIIFLLSFIILLFFIAFVYSPICKMKTAAIHYADGNFHYELNPDSSDELGYLATVLSFMAKQLSSAEDDQKKFVANISHDFRSPLTSIRGYLNAMIDGTIPPEMYDKYLNTVLNETNRLTKLTNGLLQLNNLNTKGMLLDKSIFDINYVIKNIADSFQGTIDNKSLRLSLVLTGDELLVDADMSKIEQVLYNLLDNAIKFSHPLGKLKIETTEKNSKLYVSVKDGGIGIPKDDIKKVWDRFYKSDSSRGKDKSGTGLGLAICREIIHSHGETINVVSTENAGSEFIFTLPIFNDDDLIY